MIIDLTDDNLYLEHFGVKGMRWGVRRSSENKKSESSVSSTKSSKAKKVGLAVGGAAVVGGAAIGGALLMRHLKVKNSTKAASFINKHKDVPVKTTKRLSTSSEHKAFVEEFTKKQNLLIDDANKTLRYLHDQGWNEHVFEPIKPWA